MTVLWLGRPELKIVFGWKRLVWLVTVGTPLKWANNFVAQRSTDVKGECSLLPAA